jgi:hypothetical protein
MRPARPMGSANSCLSVRRRENETIREVELFQIRLCSLIMGFVIFAFPHALISYASVNIQSEQI